MPLNRLKFVPLTTKVSEDFFFEYVVQKLRNIRLSDDFLVGLSFWRSGCTLQVGAESFQGYEVVLKDEEIDFHDDVGYVLIQPIHTLENFKTMDKTKQVKELDWFVKWIDSGKWLENPSRLQVSMVWIYGDLKHYKFYYMFGFPTIKLDISFDELELPLLPTFHDFVKFRREDHHKRGFFGFHDGKWIPMNKCDRETQYFVFKDCSDHEKYPGWVCRNFIYAIARTFNLNEFNLIALRDSDRLFSQSKAYKIKLPKDLSGKIIPGFEKDSNGLAKPKYIKMPHMDPKNMAENQVELNIQLMKWRMVPNLQDKILKETKCLLIGCGTLGCAVSRALLSWGIFNITLVDRGTVSFSNPVRQTLYTFEDSKNKKHKAIAAADRLKEIYPSCNAKGHVLNIHMPGHVFDQKDDEKVKKEIDELSSLIQSHDAIFLLTDSREARWLPTMLGRYYNKIVINSALGFDSYLVSRHGTEKSKLGCYFCSDIMGPKNSQTGRTLDMQCTVTRGGLAGIASNLAVELLVSLLHHPKKHDAPVQDHGILGAIPHQIRGELTTFNQHLLHGQCYDRCIACSQTILKEYEQRGYEFLREAIQTPGMLEDLTGLKDLQEKTDKLLEETYSDDDFELI